MQHQKGCFRLNLNIIEDPSWKWLLLELGLQACQLQWSSWIKDTRFSSFSFCFSLNILYFRIGWCGILCLKVISEAKGSDSFIVGQFVWFCNSGVECIGLLQLMFFLFLYLFFKILSLRWIYMSQGLLLVAKLAPLLTNVGITLKWDCMFSLAAITIFSDWWRR